MNNYFTGDFEIDSALMYDYLDDLELKTGNERSGQKFFNKEKGSSKPESCKVGITWRKRRGDFEREYDPIAKGYKTKLNEECPHLMPLFKEYQKHHFSTFEWSEITINRMPTGSRIKSHLDKINVGDSILVAFGDYTGGMTYVKNKNDRNYEIHDCRVAPIKFNGAERLHGVTTVSSGKRFSLVFYKNKSKPIEPY